VVALTIMSLSVNTVSAGVDKPSKKWNLDYHKYAGGGSAEGSKLYSNYYFYNVKKFNVKVVNKSSHELTVKIYEKGAWFFAEKSFTVGKNKTKTYKFTTDGKDQPYYITFSAPSNFTYEVYK
jgi:hypothetical protein